MKPRRTGKRALRLEHLEQRLALSAAPLGTGTLNTWFPLGEVPPSVAGGQPIAVSAFEPFAISESDMRSLLSAAPMEFTPEAANPLEFALPGPDGSIQRFAVVETRMMEPELAAQFPLIKTYRGVGIDDPFASAVFDYTYQGFHAQVRSPSGTFFIDPYYHLDTSVYASYYRSDMDLATVAAGWNELGVLEDGQLTPDDHDHDHDHDHENHETWDTLDQEVSPADAAPLGLSQPAGEMPHHDHPFDEDTPSIELVPRTGTQLRTYRTAVAATTEYTNFQGGTVNAGQSAIVTAINRVSGIYEDELTIRLVLVANNDLLVYTGADPYTNNNGFAMLGQNQSNLDSVIGNANYDIGHVFSTGGGGVAGLGVVGLSGSKAQGVTGLPSPVGDAFYVDYVAHEMGHQFGGSHTFNGDSGSCAGGNRSGSSAYEPGSGSTIMAYAGICGNDNLQSNSNAYFHSRSLDQIVQLMDGSRAGVGTRINTGNTIPTAEAGSNYTIPAETPFILTGAGSDADGDPLVYNWEERDLGPQQDVNSGDNGSSPIFRSWTATSDPTRTLPRLSNLLANNTVRGETLPTTNRTLNFRLTVRDNNGAGGGVATDNMSVIVRNAAGPFLVTSPNTTVTWEGGDTQTVTWDVAGTTGNGINTSQVNILLSVDGGQTYPYTVLSGTANDGSESILVPNVGTTQARLKIEAVGNIFFDVSNRNFTINERVDFEDPMAVAMAPDLLNPTAIGQTIDVTYTDDQAINRLDLDNNDIEVLAPDGSLLPAQLLFFSPSVNTSPLSATYLVVPSGGGVWTEADAGLYDIRMLANAVRDTAGNPVPAGSIGSFTISFDTRNDPGDFNGDGQLDCDDVDSLTLEIANGTNDVAYDVTGDNLVNMDDLNEWVLNLKGTLLGDANLDFVVDTSDFNIWNVNKFTATTGWCAGNFNGDGFVDASDFNIWNVNKFTSVPRPLASFATTDQTASGAPRAAGADGVFQPQVAGPTLVLPPAVDGIATRDGQGLFTSRFRSPEKERAEVRGRTATIDALDSIFAER